jgi:hypothetical protein
LTAPVPRNASVTLREAMLVEDTMWAFTDLESETPLMARSRTSLGASFALRSTTTWAVEDERATFLVRQGSFGVSHVWNGRRERTAHAFGFVLDWPFADARAWALSESETAGRLALTYVGNIETNPLDIAYDVQFGLDSSSIGMARADLVLTAPLSDHWAIAVGGRGELKSESVPWIAMAGIRARTSERVELSLSAHCVCDIYANVEPDVRIVPDASGTFRF